MGANEFFENIWQANRRRSLAPRQRGEGQGEGNRSSSPRPSSPQGEERENSLLQEIEMSLTSRVEALHRGGRDAGKVERRLQGHRAPTVSIILPRKVNQSFSLILLLITILILPKTQIKIRSKIKIKGRAGGYRLGRRNGSCQIWRSFRN